MQQIKWFDRKFDYSFQQNIFPSIMERLAGTSLRLNAKLDNLPKELLVQKKNGKWSIKENLGHLIDLEPLWQKRLENILQAEEYLEATDLLNTKTEVAQHNETSLKDLLEKFDKIRAKTLISLSKLKQEDIYRSAIHPRLQQPMRIMDLFLFVAEHDDHHLARITEIKVSDAHRVKTGD